jgi:hypothetical protein
MAAPESHAPPPAPPAPAGGMAPPPLHAAGARCPSAHTRHTGACAAHSAWRCAGHGRQGASPPQGAAHRRCLAHTRDRAGPPPTPHGGMGRAQPPQRPRPPDAPSPHDGPLWAWGHPHPALARHGLHAPPSPHQASPQRPASGPRHGPPGAGALAPSPRRPRWTARAAERWSQSARPEAASHCGWPPATHARTKQTCGCFAPPSPPPLEAHGSDAPARSAPHLLHSAA